MSDPEIFTLRHQDGKIMISVDPEIATDLIYALNTLLDLSHRIRSKVIHARALEAALNQEDIERRQNNFKSEASKIFARFQEHMNNGCAGNKAAALQGIKKDFGLGYGEAKIFIIEGRRLEKEKKGLSRTALGLEAKPLLRKRQKP